MTFTWIDVAIFAAILFINHLIIQVVNTRKLKGIIRVTEVADTWFEAKDKLDGFLLSCSDIKHPIAQRLLEEEISAYEALIKTEPYRADSERFLLFLQSMRTKKKPLLWRVK